MTTAAPTPGTLPSDEELVPRLAARDEDAVALLLARWWPRAHRRLPAPPRGHAAGSWHRVRTAVVVGRRSPWDSPQDAQRVALQARRSKVFVAEAGRMAFHEDHATFIEALRWLEE